MINIFQKLKSTKYPLASTFHNSYFAITSNAFSSNIKVQNPYSGEIHCEVDSIQSITEAKHLLSNCSIAQKSWWSDYTYSMGLVERQQICLKFIEELSAMSDEICSDISSMMGKPLQQSKNEMKTMIDRAECMITLSTQALRDEQLPPKPSFSRKIKKEPLGTIFVISPWNYPLLCTINSLIPAILSGNSVLLKISSKTPLIANHFAQAFEKAGGPKNLITPLHTSHEITSQLMTDKNIGGVVFTGSVNGGYSIQKSCSERFINCTLELGGKDPAYLHKDCDLKSATETVVDGALYNAGQSCCAIERLYVHTDIYDDFIAYATELMNSYVIGDPFDEKTSMGPMANSSSLEFLESQVEDAISKGAKMLVGDGKRCKDKLGFGQFFKPCLLTNCDHTMRVMKEESFGPIFPVMRVCCNSGMSSVEEMREVTALMNDSEYGLSAAVFSRDMNFVDRISNRIETGTVFMNRCDFVDPMLPWTGVKDTGKGVSLSLHGFQPFVKLKSCHFYCDKL